MTSKVHFYNLDILRFICAMAVALSHSFDAYLGWINTPEFLKNHDSFFNYLKMFISNLTIGVSVFFIISGFLITYLMILEKQEQGFLHVGKYMIRRALRIWPLYYISIILGYLFIKVLQMPDQPNYLANILFLNNFELMKTGVWQFPFAHFWSISVEEHFYLIWPIIIYFTPIKRIPIVAIVGIIVSMSSRYYYRMYIDHDVKLQLFCNVHTLARMDELLIGALMAYFYFKKPINFSMGIGYRIPIYIGILFLLCVSPYYFSFETLFDTLFKKYIYIFFILFWVANYVFNQKAFGNFKTKNVIHYLGKISFGIYIYHNMIIIPYLRTFVYYLHIHNMIVYLILYFIILIGVSIVSYEFFEKRFLKLKERFSIIKTEQ